MKIRFYNARILKMAEGFEITDGELHTNGGKIAYIEKTKDDGKFDREIDCRKNLLMPGFKNAHTHSAMTFLRSYADDLPLQKWLFESIFPMEAKLTPEHIYKLSKLAFMEYLSSGITACFDMYYEPESFVQASIDCGFRSVLCGAVNNFKESVEKLEAYYDKYNAINPLVSYQLGFHAEYTTRLDILKSIAELSQRKKAPVYTHNSETKSEVDECINRYGKTPTELFDDIGMLEYGGGGFHCVYLSEKDIEIFKKKKLHIVTNPASNAKLASGIAPVCDYISNGINTAIGTDGPASNNCLDMFREMFLMTALQKLKCEDASACPAEDVLYAATIGGARAMQLCDSDVLAVGKNADLVLIDLNQPNMQPLNNIVKNLVYSGSKQNVKLTMIGGKILYENGDFFIGEDAEKVYHDANEIINFMK